MNIIICIKQVPDNIGTRIDGYYNAVNRSEPEGIINPSDLFAIGKAIQIKEKNGGKLTVLCMGPLSAKPLLNDVLAMGVDRAVLLQDSIFVGSDTLATAYILSRGIKKIGQYDLVICGKESSDGGTAQVGLMLAEKLQIPSVSCTKEISVVDSKHVICYRRTDYWDEKINISTPALLTIDDNESLPFQTVEGVVASENKELLVYTSEDLDINEKKCGLKGSPTRVVDMQLMNPTRKECYMFSESDIPTALAQLLITKLNTMEKEKN